MGYSGECAEEDGGWVCLCFEMEVHVPAQGDTPTLALTKLMC